MSGFDQPADFFVNLCDIRPIRNSLLKDFGCHTSKNKKPAGLVKLLTLSYFSMLPVC